MGTINIIFDSRRHEKYEPLIKELERQKIRHYEIFPCLMFPNIVESINASHKMIVKKAKEENLDEICIAEDDLMFPSESGWEWFLSNKPLSYDIYAAANYIAFQRPTEKGAFKVDCIVGFHLYFVHSRHYDRFLNTDPKKHIDTEQKGDLYVCYPYAALQRPGYSINNKSIVNYNGILNAEDIYNL